MQSVGLMARQSIVILRSLARGSPYSSMVVSGISVRTTGESPNLTRLTGFPSYSGTSIETEQPTLDYEKPVGECCGFGSMFPQRMLAWKSCAC